MNVIGIIPARFQSTRFPGKPLVDIGGKPMLARTYEQARKARSLTHVVVATDDQRIVDCVKSFGGNVVMTSAAHQSGTDRCNEAADHLEGVTVADNDVIINIQGDEPFISPTTLDALAKRCTDPQVRIATLVRDMRTQEELFNPSTAKVIVNSKGEAVYFSRQAIPFVRDHEQGTWLGAYTYRKHVGTYAFRRSTLREVTALPPSPLEMAEKLEQLRWIEHGYPVVVVHTEYDSMSVDTPDDLKKVWNYI